MNKMPPEDSSFGHSKMDRNTCGRHKRLVRLDDSYQSREDMSLKEKRKKRKIAREIQEEEDYIKIKGIQKTQEVVNKSLRRLHLESLKINRTKRVEEAVENIRKRKEAQQQKSFLKNVVNGMRTMTEELFEQQDLNESHCYEHNKENLLINKNSSGTQSNEKKIIDNSDNGFKNKTYSLPPLVRAPNRRPFIPMASSNKAQTGTSGVTDMRKGGGHKRSIVITIPDVHTDASFSREETVLRLTKSANSTLGSVCNTERSKSPVKDESTQHPTSAKSRYSETAKSKYSDLPPVNFTLQYINDPPISYYIEKNKMISYRPLNAIPPVKSPEERSSNPTMVVSPRNSSISIPLVRKEQLKDKDNLSVVGKNPQIPLGAIHESQSLVGRVYSYDLRSTSCETSSTRSRSPPRQSMKGSKLIKKRVKDFDPKKDKKYVSNTGFVISEFPIQDRATKKPNFHIEKQSVHEFPNQVREKYIKKKLLMTQSENYDSATWKIRRYITDPGSFSSTIATKDTSHADSGQPSKWRAFPDDHGLSSLPNKKDISDLLLRMLLKQSPRGKIRPERTIPSTERLENTLSQMQNVSDRNEIANNNKT